MALVVVLMVSVVAVLIRWRIKSPSGGQKRTKRSVLRRVLVTHLQVLSLVARFRVNWPPVVEGMLTAYRTVSSVSEHLVSFECMASSSTDSSYAAVFYSSKLLLALGPVVASILCVSIPFCINIYSPRCFFGFP